MEKTVAVFLRAFAWLILVIGVGMWVWLLVSAFQARSAVVEIASIVLMLSAFGALLAGGVLWAVLMMLGFTLDAVLNLRDRD